jgi:BlaI family penicillinase repressor
MDIKSLSDGEWKLMNLLWDRAPLTILDMTTALKGSTGWSKATVNIMINRLVDKGAVRIDSSERTKRVYPVLAHDDAVRHEAKNTLEKIKTGGLGLLLSAMTEECSLSEAEIDELTRILKEGK